MQRSELDAAIRTAFESQDWAGLSRLYLSHAQTLEQSGEPDAACFFAANGYVLALEAGIDEAADLRELLVRHGREV